MATIEVSNIPAAPAPILERREVISTAPVLTMIMAPDMIPTRRIANTLKPIIPPISTRM